jgi:periplasmic divalent cation tolerance protein
MRVAGIRQLLYPMSRRLYRGKRKANFTRPGGCAVESTDVVIVLTTLPTGVDAGAFARALVDEHLAACVSASGEIHSVYRWEGRVTDDVERQIVIKTIGGRVPDLQARLVSLHPYVVPEFIVLTAAGGGADYLAWVRQSVMA